MSKPRRLSSIFALLVEAQDIPMKTRIKKDAIVKHFFFMSLKFDETFNFQFTQFLKSLLMEVKMQSIRKTEYIRLLAGFYGCTSS